MTAAPRACPNLGVDCDYPACLQFEAACAAANVGPVKSREELQAQADALDGDPRYVVEQTPSAAPRLPYELPAPFPITADDIFKKER